MFGFITYATFASAADPDTNAPAPPADQATATPPASLQEIIVNAQRRGYREDTVSSVGPFGAMPLLDTPYSINVTSAT